MKHLTHTAALLILILFMGVAGPLYAENKAIIIKTPEGKTEIAFLQGGAFLVQKDLTKIRPLIQGEYLTAGNRILTEKNSRIELKLPDNSFVRFDEETTFLLESSGIDKTEKKRDIRLNLFMGKVWAKVARYLGNRGRFTVSTQTATAGVRGTTYRMNVNPDKSVVVKVYDGEVGVKGKKQSDKSDQMPTQKPRVVSGPHPVAGPHPVSMKEWTYIVKSMQQINISPDGIPSEPFRFDRDKDLNDWVRWNLERDRVVKNTNQ